jgi:hypothetical protein
MTNRYLADADPERAAARKIEIKRKLAQRELNRQKIDELNAIIKKLDADSDDAAEQHQLSASKLQEELDKLDEQHISLILEGKSSSSSKSLQRRSEILSELASLNQSLETRCDANRRSQLPFRKQVEQLRLEVGRASTLENELLELGGSKYRVAQAVSELTIQTAKIALNEAVRMQGIHSHNLTIEKDWNRANNRTSSEQTQIEEAKLSDATKVVEHFQQRLDEALRASERQRKLAVTE